MPKLLGCFGDAVRAEVGKSRNGAVLSGMGLLRFAFFTLVRRFPVVLGYFRCEDKMTIACNRPGMHEAGTPIYSMPKSLLPIYSRFD
jgi:hypothetical protein